MAGVSIYALGIRRNGTAFTPARAVYKQSRAKGCRIIRVAANKTKPTKLNVKAFIDALPDQVKRVEAKALVKLMQNATGEKPKMWGPSIIGFGAYHYIYDSGREGDMPLVGFSPRKTATVLYNVKTNNDEALLDKLGKYATGKGCLYLKRLADVDQTVLEAMVVNSVAAITQKRGGRTQA
jgi:Domain of unknown function (DU1801)